ncbi:MAG: siphovirus Gp157 family protein [Bacteroidaceae bacterium]|nr:siphovirus Gp157 family protein [Bacteroidaceae bacterium]
MKATLFDIVGEFQQLYEMATSEEEQAEQVFIDTLDSLKGELEVKSSGYCAVINRLEAEQAKAEEIAKAYTAVAKRRKSAIKYMKDTLLMAMDALDKTEMPAGELTIKIKKNGGLQPLVIDGEVPDNMTKVTIEPDNEKIRAFLKDNTCDFAHLEERGRHIEIK